MSDGQWVGVVIVLAMAALCVYEFWVAPLLDDVVDQAAAALMAGDGRWGRG